MINVFNIYKVFISDKIMFNMKYEFIDRTLFIPEKGILVVGDLHLGYEYMLKKSGILLPKNQIKQLIKDLEKIFKKIKTKYKLKKIIFLGDIKHSFSFEWNEKNEFVEVLEFLKKYFNEKNIILIKGNHDTIDYSFNDKLKEIYTKDGIAFIHGHKNFNKLFDKKIKTIVMAHIHPSIIFYDKQTSKRERYKCFLKGKFKEKDIFILPSFLNLVEGTPINEYNINYDDSFSIIPKKSLMNFEVFVVGKDKIYNFKKLKNIT